LKAASSVKHIAICGAGPAGLAAALFLHRAGHKVEIIERFAEPAAIGSGLILQPTGLTVLAALGQLDRILALGHRIDRLHGSDAKSGRTVLDVKYASGPNGRFGLAVQRAALFETLYTAVRSEGIAVQSNATIAGVTDIASQPLLQLADGGHAGPYDLVIDASGTRSQLVAALLPQEQAVDLAYGAYWATLDAGSFPYERHALLQRYEHAEVMIGALPIGRSEPTAPEKLAFFWSQKVVETAALHARGLDALKNRVLGYWPEMKPLIAQINSWDDMVLARYQHRTLKRPARGKVIFIGDAAHCTSPQLGQGANMALLDAAALTFALDGNADVLDAAAAYCRLRRNHVRLFQGLSRMFTPFYQSDSHLISAFRDRMVATTANLPPIPRLLASIVSGTVLNPLGVMGLEEIDWRGKIALDDGGVTATACELSR
jgi:2-polyprenyl-6-methoxyphenol hydroxylase-like FAD-dependent oxidoreductase